MGAANPAMPGWGCLDVSASLTLDWSHHGMTIRAISGGDDPVVITLPKVADFDKFQVRVMQLSENVQIVTTATGGVYDKFLMPNTPGLTEKIEPGGRGFAYARVEVFGDASAGWLVVGGDGVWEDSDTSDNRFVLGGNVGGAGGTVASYDTNGQLTDSPVDVKSVVTKSDMLLTGSGSPSGVVEGFGGQMYQDTVTGDLYVNIDGSMAWVKFYDAP
jgi:hypothetical protein